MKNIADLPSSFYIRRKLSTPWLSSSPRSLEDQGLSSGLFLAVASDGGRSSADTPVARRHVLSSCYVPVSVREAFAGPVVGPVYCLDYRYCLVLFRVKAG